MKFFADWIQKALAHLDTGNQHNCNIIWTMLSLFTEFITEFESTWAITVYLNDYLLKVKGRSIREDW